MASETSAFTLVCDALEQRTSLGRLEARGTVRIALKNAGLDAGSVRPAEMAVVVQRVLPRELASRGVPDADAMLSELHGTLLRMSSATAHAPAGPEEVFRRLGG